MSETDIEQQVAATLASHAEGLDVERRPFEPIHVLPELGGGDLAGPPPGYADRRRVQRAVAAVAASAVAVAGVAAVVARSGDDANDDVRLGAVAGLPAEALVPTWDGPDGWELSTLDWGGDAAWDVDDAILFGGPMWHAPSVQLFGARGDDGALERALLVEVGDAGIAEGPERTTVRGRPGQWGPDDRDPDATRLIWSEEEELLRATYRGLSTAEAVALLDVLVVGPGGVQAGFDVPAGGLPGGLALLGEATDPEQGPATVSATFGPGVPVEPGVPERLRYKASVETLAPAGGLTPAYLTAWFMGERDGAGVVRWWTSRDELLDGIPENEGVLQTHDPDGRAVWVMIDEDAVAADGLGAPEEVARDITGSVVPATSERLRELWEGLVDQWVARDLVVAVPTPAGTVELRGTGSEAVLCLRDGEALSCAPAEHPDPNSPPDGGNFDGQWTASVATEDGDHLVAVSDKGPILMETTVPDEDGPGGQRFVHLDAEVGEGDGSWAAVLPATTGGEDTSVRPITDVAREAEGCLDMLGSDLDPDGARPADEARIRAEGGGPAAMYQACRELTQGSWHQDVGP